MNEDMEKKSGDPDNPLHYTERRERIKRLIEKVGILNINKSALAEQFDVSRDTIYNDWEKILEEMEVDVKDLNETSIALTQSIREAVKQSHRIMTTSEDERNRLSAAKTLGSLSKDLVGTLEAFGVKEKVADRIDVSGSYDDLREQVYSAVKSLKGDDTPEDVEETEDE